jgi:hypothetical protein
VRAVPSATAALAVAAPLALAGLPGPSVLTLGISGAGFPRAGHSYTYLVSVDDPAREPAWLVHLAISAPAGATVIAAGGGRGACRVGPGGAGCVWPQLTDGATVGVSVTVSLGSGLRAGGSLAASAQLSYDWGQVSESATSVWVVDGPPRPKVRPKPPPRVAVTLPSPPSRVSPVSPPSQPAPGSPLSAVRPHRAAAPSRTPRPRPSRSPSPGAFFPRTASKLIVPPRSLPAPGLPKGLLIVLVMAPCVAAAVTRFARGR